MMNQVATVRASRGLTTAMSAGLGQPAHPRISIQGGRFTLVDANGNQLPCQTFDPQLGVYVDVIVVDLNQNVSKVYYAEAFDPTATDYKPPMCYSDNGVGASRAATVPQSPSCQTCPHNVWGSDVSRVTGKETKACNDMKKLAVIIPSDPYNMIYELRVPPASLKNLRAYSDYLAKQKHPHADRAVDAADVVTRVYFQQGVQGVLNFFHIGHVDLGSADDLRVNAIFNAEDQGQDVTGSITGKRDVPVDPAAFGAGQAPALTQRAAPAALPPPPAAPPAQQFQTPQPPVASTVPTAAPASAFGGAQQSVPPQPAPASGRGRGGNRAGAGRPPKSAEAGPAQQAQSYVAQQFGGAPQPQQQPQPQPQPQPQQFQPRAAQPVQMPQGNAGDMPPIPSQFQRASQPTQQQQPQPQQFGMQPNAPGAPADVAAALDRAFAQPV